MNFSKYYRYCGLFEMPITITMQYVRESDARFISRFKAELIQKGTFLDFDNAYTEIFEFIESH
jgi:hypothetical protein